MMSQVYECLCAGTSPKDGLHDIFYFITLNYVFDIFDFSSKIQSFLTFTRVPEI